MKAGASCVRLGLGRYRIGPAAGDAPAPRRGGRALAVRAGRRARRRRPLRRRTAPGGARPGLRRSARPCAARRTDQPSGHRDHPVARRSRAALPRRRAGREPRPHFPRQCHQQHPVARKGPIAPDRPGIRARSTTGASRCWTKRPAKRNGSTAGCATRARWLLRGRNGAAAAQPGPAAQAGRDARRAGRPARRYRPHPRQDRRRRGAQQAGRRGA